MGEALRVRAVEKVAEKAADKAAERAAEKAAIDKDVRERIDKCIKLYLDKIPIQEIKDRTLTLRMVKNRLKEEFTVDWDQVTTEHSAYIKKYTQKQLIALLKQEAKKDAPKTIKQGDDSNSASSASSASSSFGKGAAQKKAVAVLGVEGGGP